MSINWFASLKDVAWEQVLAVAPSIVERGKKIWSKSTDREGQVAEAEISTVLSPPVQGALAGQHSELVHAVDVLLIRTRVLLRVCMGLGLAVVALVLVESIR